MGRTNRYNPEFEDKRQRSRKKKRSTNRNEGSSFKPEKRKKNRGRVIGDYEENFEKFRRGV